MSEHSAEKDAATFTPAQREAAEWALREAERRIVEMADHRYYAGSQEIGARDALSHVREVRRSVLPPATTNYGGAA